MRGSTLYTLPSHKLFHFFVIMNTAQIVAFTEAFPPAHKLTETLVNIDYKKHLNTFMDAVMNLCAFIAVIATLIADKWQENDVTERLQIVALNAYTWTRNVAVPAVKNAATVTYNAGQKVREVYEVINSPLFVTL
mgnify:FL=1